jgi:hypothetical protein
VLWGVVCSEAALGAFLLEKLSKRAASVFTAAVRPESLDLGAVLSARPSREGFVGSKGLILGAKNVDACVAGEVIGERDIVESSAKASGWRGAPEVGVDFGSKFLSWWGHALAPNGLAHCLGVLARVAYDRRAIVDELNARDGVVADEGTDGVGRDMAKTPMEGVYVDLLDCAGT